MIYVYILISIENPKQHYVGITRDLKARLISHNAGKSAHTAKFKPWKLETYIAFSDEQKAGAFKVPQAWLWSCLSKEASLMMLSQLS